MDEPGEPVVPFRVRRENVPLGTEFRSTWLSASLARLRARGIMDRYLALLPQRHHEAVLHSIAGTWLPAEIAVEHYRAFDGLGDSPAEMIQGGRDITLRLEKTIFALGFRAARELGVTPWAVLRMLPTVWEREWRGGGMAVFRLAPKDARVEFAGFPCAPIPYCRIGMRGVIMAMCDLVCSKAFCREVPRLCTGTTLGYHVSWA
jgi:hypothetical protein